MQRKRVVIEGIVQGVGFRPFVFQAAQKQHLAGWVRNDSCGVLIEAEGKEEALNSFLDEIRNAYPPLAAISRFAVTDLPAVGERGFTIRESHAERAGNTIQISPDTYVCADCLHELFDPADRRYRYPFINCTNCGPRYTIITAVPYDRPHTTMASFPMCVNCREEYENPSSRRFHAQPNACPACGPQLRLLDGNGHAVQTEDPVRAAADLLQAGGIVAVKGLGGYHLAADAGCESAIRTLRRRKERDEKPFAIMSFSPERIAHYADMNETELRLLTSVERPIVLLRRRNEVSQLCHLVAPRNRYLGVMLPYTPLHYLLLEEFSALVMTSANISDEPIVFDDEEACRRLAGIADYFLVHDRRIHVRTDDSIARVMAGRPLVLRRSRGFVPRGILLPHEQPAVLAVGAELKSAFCLTLGNRGFLSQHIGDLKNVEIFRSFEGAIDHLENVLQWRPEIIAHDLHPDYYSTRYAEERGGCRRVAVQHHHAHLASCLAENGEAGEVIGVIFDGTGYGTDGRIWGGEFLIGDFTSFRRVGHLAFVPMPGGDAAVREPWRMAVSYLHQAFGCDFPRLPLLDGVPERDVKLLLQMIEKGINSPMTSSCGRLFDAVAALVGLRRQVSYEGQAALELEMCADLETEESETYPWQVSRQEDLLLITAAPLVRALVDDLCRGTPVPLISRRFHLTLTAMIVEVCQGIRQFSGLETVAFSGGVFQNRFLTEAAVDQLSRTGFRVLTHSLVPPNDGGLALGQAVVAGAALSR